MLPRRSSGELYRLLEVDALAPPEAIKKAYHKKALVLHPDKTGGETTEAFKAVKVAHEVLIDPEQRRLYDSFGREGMKSLNQYSMGGAAAFAAGSPLATKVIAGTLFFISALLLLFTSFVVSKIDDHKGWPWAVVFIPVWILFALLLPMGVVMVGAGVSNRKPEQTMGGASLICSCMVIIAFVRSLDGHLRWENTSVVVLLTVVVNWLLMFLNLRIQNIRATLGAPELKVFSAGYAVIAAVALFKQISWMLFFILLYLRLCDGAYADLSFYCIFAPLFGRFGLPTLVEAATTLAKSASSCRQKLGQLIAKLFGGAFILSFFALVSVKCQREVNEDRSGPSAAVCAIPLFIVLSISTLVLTYALCSNFDAVRESEQSAAAEEEGAASSESAHTNEGAADENEPHGNMDYRAM